MTKCRQLCLFMGFAVTVPAAVVPALAQEQPETASEQAEQEPGALDATAAVGEHQQQHEDGAEGSEQLAPKAPAEALAGALSEASAANAAQEPAPIPAAPSAAAEQREPAAAADVPEPTLPLGLELHGAVLTYGSFFRFGKIFPANEFSGAFNLEGAVRLSEHLTGGFNIQAAPGGDYITFKETPALVVTDLFVAYQDLLVTGLSITAGSFDTPFSDQVEVVSNNADTLRNPFVMNSLFMSFFGGTVGTLNTLGILLTYETSAFDVSTGVTNGTDESTLNIDRKFETFADLGVNLGDWARLAGSVVHSDDREGARTTGIGADLFAWVVDVKLSLASMIAGDAYIKGYVGQGTLGDEDKSTKDGLLFWMAEAKVPFLEHFYLAARFSAWKPDDSNGDGVGMSAAFISPGLAQKRADEGGFILVTDQAVTRLQVAAAYHTDSGADALPFVLKLICVYDNYARRSGGRSTDMLGGILAANLGF